MFSTVKWIQLLILLVLFIIVFIIGLSFYFRNDQLVVLDYFLGSKERYFSFWLLSFMVFGVFMGWLTIIPVILKLKRNNIKLLRQARVNEKEINNLRIIPIKDAH